MPFFGKAPILPMVEGGPWDTRRRRERLRGAGRRPSQDAHAAGPDDTIDIQRHIDQLVGELWGLTRGELVAMES